MGHIYIYKPKFQNNIKLSQTSRVRIQVRRVHFSMSRRAAAQMSRLLLGHTRQRLFSTATFKDVITTQGATSKFFGPRFTNNRGILGTPILEVRHWSTTAAPEEAREEKPVQPRTIVEYSGKDKAVISSYWGVAPPKISKEDGSPWRWNSFRVRVINNM